jgi:Ser/Thr protein kinase RdoA (MazF antagonist)
MGSRRWPARLHHWNALADCRRHADNRWVRKRNSPNCNRQEMSDSKVTASTSQELTQEQREVLDGMTNDNLQVIWKDLFSQN